jgi:hypothetical protein
MSIKSLLRQRATIERATLAVDGAGGAARTWAQVASDVPCLIEVKRSDAEIRSTGRVSLAFARGYFAADTDLRPRADADGADRVTVEGVTYDVTGCRVEAGQAEKLLVAELAVAG